jgi:hypothetical protein
MEQAIMHRAIACGPDTTLLVSRFLHFGRRFRTLPPQLAPPQRYPSSGVSSLTQPQSSQSLPTLSADGLCWPTTPVKPESQRSAMQMVPNMSPHTWGPGVSPYRRELVSPTVAISVPAAASRLLPMSGMDVVEAARWKDLGGAPVMDGTVRPRALPNGYTGAW